MRQSISRGVIPRVACLVAPALAGSTLAGAQPRVNWREVTVEPLAAAKVVSQVSSNRDVRLIFVAGSDTVVTSPIRADSAARWASGVVALYRRFAQSRIHASHDPPASQAGAAMLALGNAVAVTPYRAYGVPFLRVDVADSEGRSAGVLLPWLEGARIARVVGIAAEASRVLTDGELRGIAPVRVTMAVRRSDRRVEYPDDLRRARIGGEVQLMFVVDSTGAADLATMCVIKSTDPRLEFVVRSALPGMRFEPAKVDGHPVRQQVVLPFTFRIDYGFPPLTSPPGRP